MRRPARELPYPSCVTYGAAPSVLLPTSTVRANGRLPEAALPIQVRLLLLVAAYVAGGALNAAAPALPSFALLTLVAMAALILAFVFRRPQGAVLGGVVVALDLAWVLFALHFTGGLASPLVPLLYAVVALACLRSNSLDIGIAVAGAVVGIFTIAYVWESDPGLALSAAAGQAALLGAVTVVAYSYANWLRANGTRRIAEADVYRSLLSHSRDIIAATDQQFRLRSINEGGARLLGVGQATAAAQGRDLFELIQPHSRATTEVIKGQLAAGRPVFNLPLDGRTAEGRELSLELTAVPVAGQGIDGVCLMLKDVTDLRHYQRDLAQPGRQASINQVVTTITHELNNPLAAIRLCAELSALTNSAERAEEIMELVDRCDDVIQGLQQYTTRRTDSSTGGSHHAALIETAR
jgi:PAS domain S-box-containing protein